MIAQPQRQMREDIMTRTVYALSNDKAQICHKRAVFYNDPETAGDVVAMWKAQGFLVRIENET